MSDRPPGRAISSGLIQWLPADWEPPEARPWKQPEAEPGPVPKAWHHCTCADPWDHELCQDPHDHESCGCPDTESYPKIIDQGSCVVPPRVVE